MGVAHGTEKAWLLEHKVAIDQHFVKPASPSLIQTCSGAAAAKSSPPRSRPWSMRNGSARAALIPIRCAPSVAHPHDLGAGPTRGYGRSQRISYASRKAGGPNLVRVSRSSSGPPGRNAPGNAPDQDWADPPTAVCGQPGAKGSGSPVSAPVSERNRSSVPAATGRRRRFSSTPLGGTPGRSGKSDQSSVAQPDSGCCDPQVCRGRPSSRRTSRMRPPAVQ